MLKLQNTVRSFAYKTEKGFLIDLLFLGQENLDKTTVTNMSPGKNDSGASKITGSDEKVWTIFPFKAVLFQVNMKIVF